MSKSKISIQRAQEKRLSRIKITRDFILSNLFLGQLNNRKWQSVFEALECHKLEFELKTVLSKNFKSCSFIRELEESSLLIDDSGDFIEFLEIDSLRIIKSELIEKILEELRINYEDVDGYYEIIGYVR